MPVQLLFVEDVEDDVLLILRELKRGGFEVDYRTVDSAKALESALTERAWDIVVTDHNMPGFDSRAAFEIVHHHNPDLPVIIVSGSIGEEVAVAAMRMGAKDYIMKDNLRRLGPAIRRELDDSGARRARRRAEAAIKHLALHDPLTGLDNRTSFLEALDAVLDKTQRQDGHHSLLFLDLDQFKVVNDTCGHLAGDEMLKQLADVLRRTVRANDRLARLGGDEFCILLESCVLDRAREIAETLRLAVHDFRFFWNGKLFSVGVSIGIVGIDRNSGGANDILSAADIACYAAKDRGRDAIQVYEQDDVELTRRRGEMDWVGRIDNALDGGHFRLWRQPIRSLTSNGANVHHYELLLRMLDDDGNIILPGAFLPAAERYDRMRAIDRWVVDKALRYVGEHRSPGEQFHSINLSGASIGDDSLRKFVGDRIAEHRVDPRSICFEVTETAAIGNFTVAVDFMQDLRQLGCRFALDDFGSGLSSFAYLKSLPVDFIKIDGRFIRSLGTDPMDRAIVEAIHKVAHVANLQTIAEFVEDTAIVEVLRTIGVDFAQGYGIGKPEPLPELERRAVANATR
ncbi:MAG: EAL domain-containing protein [Gammaproteobacteria bacterium]|nr:EAL domain-containing protein [Gammaproteobacteria bacterium]MBU1415311.1 EAL domain-containing protein [Gammaproteobacteria bacterium]